MKKSIVVLFSLFASNAIAANTDWGAIKTLKCFYDHGVSYDGKNVETSSKPFGKDKIVYDSIDIRKGTVRMVGNAGSETLTILSISPVLNFVEKTPSGNLVFTGFVQDKSGKIHVVMSRHISQELMDGTPTFSQQHGSCEVLN